MCGSRRKVSGDVGYNVNGCQNGIWLPGNYAVTNATGAIGVWEGARRGRQWQETNYANFLADHPPLHPWPLAIDEDGDHEPGLEPVAPAPNVSDPAFLLTGANYEIEDTNAKWCYVKKAMDLIDGHQFHDSHEDYSTQIVAGGYLEKLKTLMDACYSKYVVGDDGDPACPDCAERLKRKGTVGAPYDLVDRLNAISRSLSGYLRKKAASNVYTSQWVAEEMKRINADASARSGKRRAAPSDGRAKRRRDSPPGEK